MNTLWPNRRLWTVLGLLVAGALLSTEVRTMVCVQDRLRVQEIRGIATIVDGNQIEVVAGAAISIVRDQFEKEVIADEDGYFSISGLAPGRYQVKAELEGFLATGAFVWVVKRSLVPPDLLVVGLESGLDACGEIWTETTEEVRRIQRKRRVLRKHRQ